jgi:hypothetical protein
MSHGRDIESTMCAATVQQPSSATGDLRAVGWMGEHGTHGVL